MNDQIAFSLSKQSRPFFFLILFSFLSLSSLQAANMTYTVTSVADSGPGTLRQAIINSNANTPTTANMINFNLSGTGPFTIQPLTPLDPITKPVVINGYTQPGSSPNNAAEGTNAVLKIELNGSNYTVGIGPAYNLFGDPSTGSSLYGTGNGLTFMLGSGGSSVKGLVINEWVSAGIFILGDDIAPGNYTIAGNFIGTDVTGTRQRANGSGIFSVLSSFNTIGTTQFSGLPLPPAPADTNLIAGSFFGFTGGCIVLFGDFQDVVQNNLIGTDATGTAVLGNSTAGIYLGNAGSNHLIGGSGARNGNLISGHEVMGLEIYGLANSEISYNFIGTDVTGTTALGNKNAGIYLTGNSTFNGIINNLISGNGTGIIVGGNDFGSTNFNSIFGNQIGTDITGTLPLGNLKDGIWLFDSGNTIGNPSSGNLISANGRNGVLITSSAQENLVINNFIGTDVTGITALGNGKNGIQLGTPGGANGAIFNAIGASGQGNIISGNRENGIEIECFSFDNLIQGNLIGIGASGSPLPNERSGILIETSYQNLIGGATPDLGNVIAFNNRYGILVGLNFHDTATQDNVILSNSIFANKKLGIELTEIKNQPLPHAPEITSAHVKNGLMKIKGSLQGAPRTSYNIQFFATPSAKPGQGEVLLGQILVTTNAEGSVSFDATMGSVTGKTYITATSTRLGGALNPIVTSEFSSPKKLN